MDNILAQSKNPQAALVERNDPWGKNGGTEFLVYGAGGGLVERIDADRHPGGNLAAYHEAQDAYNALVNPSN